MARLLQDSQNFIKYRGWYGTCASCTPFKLQDHLALIQSVSQFYVKPVDGENRTGTTLVAELNTSNPSFFWDITELKCGGIYEITLKKGTGVLDIPNLTISEYNKGDQGRIVTKCGTTEPSNKLEFRCHTISGKKVLQVKNNLKPTHSNFSNRDTSATWSTMYTYIPTHSNMTEDAHTLADAFWADVAVPLDYIDKLNLNTQCCKNETKFNVAESTGTSVGGTTSPNDLNVNANSFAYTGELCIGNSKGGSPASILLYMGSSEYKTDYPIGKIDTLGGLDSDTISFKVTKDSTNEYFTDKLVGRCFTGKIVEGVCKLYLSTDSENTAYTTIGNNTITIKKMNNSGYLQIYVNGKATFIFNGDNSNSNDSATGASNNYPLVLCESDVTPTPKNVNNSQEEDEELTPTPISIPTPTPVEPTPTPQRTPTSEPPLQASSENCCGDDFAHTIRTTGTMEQQNNPNGLDTNQFEDGGILCFHVVQNTGSPQQFTVMINNEERFGIINVTGTLSNNYVVYKDPDGNCFGGTLIQNEITNLASLVDDEPDGAMEEPNDEQIVTPMPVNYISEDERVVTPIPVDEEENISNEIPVQEICIQNNVIVDIIDGKYSFHEGPPSVSYAVGKGVYVIDIPVEHPILLEDNNENLVFLSEGILETGNYGDGRHGLVKLNVLGDFGTISYKCAHHGYMGGLTNLRFSSECPSGTPPESNDENLICTEDAKICEDGTVLSRDPNNNCEFPSCPDVEPEPESEIPVEPIPCPYDIKICEDGTELSRDPNNNCEFPECPELETTELVSNSDCCDEFPFSIETTGTMEQQNNPNGLDTNQFEEGGKLCFHEVQNTGSPQQFTVMINEGLDERFGIINVTGTLTNNYVVYTDPVGRCYEGTLMQGDITNLIEI